MKTATSCIAIAIALGTLTASAQRRARIVSPQIHEDGNVTFQLRAPAAEDVKVNGQWKIGSVALEKAENGVWSVTVGPVEPGVWEYSFQVAMPVSSSGWAKTLSRLAFINSFPSAGAAPCVEKLVVNNDNANIGRTRMILVFISGNCLSRSPTERGLLYRWRIWRRYQSVNLRRYSSHGRMVTRNKEGKSGCSKTSSRVSIL